MACVLRAWGRSAAAAAGAACASSPAVIPSAAQRASVIFNCSSSQPWVFLHRSHALCVSQRSVSTSSSLLFAAKPEAKKEGEAPPAKIKTRFDADGRVILDNRPTALMRQNRQKLAIQAVDDPNMFRFVPPGLKYTVIELKRTSNMTRGGKKASMSALVVVGNEDGAAGFGFGRATETRDSINKAILRAYRMMIPVSRLDNHTLHTKAMGDCRATRVFARPAREGKGLVCHKFIAATCKLAGIKNMSADVLGAMTPLSILRAFFQVMQAQYSVQERAQEEGKTVLEYRDPTRPPAIIFRPELTPEAREQQVAREATLGWIRTFPLPQNFKNFLTARKLLNTPGSADSTLTGEAKAVAEWLAKMPRKVVLTGTALEGCSVPPSIKAL